MEQDSEWSTARTQVRYAPISPRRSNRRLTALASEPREHGLEEWREAEGAARCGRMGLLATGVVSFLCGGCLCLALFWWRYTPLLERKSQHEQMLLWQEQLSYQQADLLRHLRHQLLALQEEGGGKPLADVPDCAREMESEYLLQPHSPAPGPEDDNEILRDLKVVVTDLLLIEYYTTTTTTTTTTSTATTTTTTTSSTTSSTTTTSATTLTSTTSTSSSTATTNTGTFVTTSLTTGTSTISSSSSSSSSAAASSSITTSTISITASTTSITSTGSSTYTSTTTHATTLEGSIGHGDGGGDGAESANSQTSDTSMLPKTPYAFVTMAHAEGGALDHFWGAVALARMLQRLSAFPLLVLTDLPELPGGGDLREGLRRLNAFALPLGAVPAPAHMWNTREHPTWSVAWWKLSIWRLTRYEKLVWLDADSAVTRSLDWLFTRPGMWAQSDDWLCELQRDRASTGILSFAPNESHYAGMLEYSKSLKALPHGDQQLVAMYFSEVVGDKIKLLSGVDAAFGKCLGTARTPYLSENGRKVRGLWDLPAFVHQSGGWQGSPRYANACFSTNMTLQRYRVHGSALNMCHFHPLGSYWREHFCQASELLGITLGTPAVEAYCEDTCWHTGSSVQLPPGMAATLCSPVHGTLSYADYNRPTVGWPR